MQRIEWCPMPPEHSKVRPVRLVAAVGGVILTALVASAATAATASETPTEVVQTDDATIVVEQVDDASMVLPDLEPGEAHIDATDERTIYTFNIPQP